MSAPAVPPPTHKDGKHRSLAVSRQTGSQQQNQITNHSHNRFGLRIVHLVGCLGDTRKYVHTYGGGCSQQAQPVHTGEGRDNTHTGSYSNGGSLVPHGGPVCKRLATSPLKRNQCTLPVSDVGRGGWAMLFAWGVSAVYPQTVLGWNAFPFRVRTPSPFVFRSAHAEGYRLPLIPLLTERARRPFDDAKLRCASE